MTKVMFGFNSHSHSHSHNYKVTEVKAPTDESIKLYKEMLEKSRTDLVDAFKIKSNSFECSAAIYRNISSFSFTVVIKFLLNDRKHVMDFNIEEYNVNQREDLVREIVKKFSESLVEIILADLDFMTGINTIGL